MRSSDSLGTTDPTPQRHAASHRYTSSGRRSIRAAAFATPIEGLEGRRLMAADPFRVGKTPVYTPTTSDLSDVKNGPLAKGGGALANIFAEYAKYVKKGGVRARFESTYADTYYVNKNVMGVTIRTRGSVDDMANVIKENGGVVTRRVKADKILEAVVPISQVDNLAVNKSLMHIRPMLLPKVRSEGLGVNEAERGQKTDSVLTGFGADGSGETIGVISDSFGSYFADSADGDLPDTVTIVRDDVPGSDEGRAMAQLIYDIAPGADLAFSTAGLSQLEFAAAIRNLRDVANSTIIVDDIGFFAEPYFQPGVIDQAIDDVVEDGANYFSAAGNSAYSGYQRKAEWVADPDNPGGYLVDFDPGKGVDTKLDITLRNVDLANPAAIFFQWDDAYDGVVGSVTADVDIYLYRGSVAYNFSIDNNFATGIPLELLQLIDAGDYEIVIKLDSLAKGADLPGYYKFGLPANGPDVFDARTDAEYVLDDQTAGSVFGHSLTRSGVSVGAVPASGTAAFGQFKNFINEDFSSAGKGLDLFDENGNRLDEPLVRDGALLSGVDGVTTTVPGFSTFFGTSAAAPNVAALAALLREIDGSDPDPETIVNALVASAKQQPLNGDKAGTLGVQGGFGLVDGVIAASRLDSTIPTARIDVPASSSGVGSITVRFSEPVTGVDVSDFLLTRDGTNANRFRGNETVRDTGDGKTYVIENLKSATQTLGTYTLRLRNSGTEIEDAGGNVSLGQYISFDVTLRAPGDLRVEQLGDGKVRLRFADTNDSEDGYRIERATNPDFTKGINRFNLSANSTSFSDSTIEPGTAYYYRIRAERGGKYGSPALINIYNGSRGEVFVDQSSARLSGNWTVQRSSSAWLQSYASASRTGSLPTDRANTATFTADLDAGNYFAYVRYDARKTNAKNTLVEVLVNGEVAYSARLDQTKRGGGWVFLTDVINETGGDVSVRFSSRGANGNVVADAVRFLPGRDTGEE